jgi:hypothetical protein
LDEAIDELFVKALIKKEYRTLSIHRLVQQAYLHHLYTLDPSKLQSCINATSQLLYAVFPKQVNGRNMYNEAVQCQMFIQHGNSLAVQFSSLKREKLALCAPVELFELLKNCAWFANITNFGYSEANDVEGTSMRMRTMKRTSSFSA